MQVQNIQSYFKPTNEISCKWLNTNKFVRSLPESDALVNCEIEESGSQLDFETPAAVNSTSRVETAQTIIIEENNAARESPMS